MEQEVKRVAETRLETVQSQKLSQDMQTALHLLSMDLIELSEYLLRAVQENPALEYVPPVKSPMDYAIRIRTRFRRGLFPAGGERKDRSGYEDRRQIPESRRQAPLKQPC